MGVAVEGDGSVGVGEDGMVGDAGGEGVTVGAWGCVVTVRHATSDAATSTTHSTAMTCFTTHLLEREMCSVITSNTPHPTQHVIRNTYYTPNPLSPHLHQASSIQPVFETAQWNGTKLTFVVMDNSWTSMTGHQVCPATGMDARSHPAKVILIEDVARAFGVKSVEVVDPYNLSEAEEAIRRALDFDGVAVVVARRECMLQVLRRERKWKEPVAVTDDCVGCGLCVQLGCPAITFQDGRLNCEGLKQEETDK